MTKLKRITVRKIGTRFLCKCLECRKEFLVKGFEYRVGKGKFCSRKCHGDLFRGKPRKEVSDWSPNAQQRKNIIRAQTGRFAGPKHWNWKGGKCIDSNGYVAIFKPEHPFPNFQKKYVYEHRLVMEKTIGRFLTRKEIVHHKNKIVSDNRIENLELISSQSVHVALHNSLRGN